MVGKITHEASKTASQPAVIGHTIIINFNEMREFAVQQEEENAGTSQKPARHGRLEEFY